MSDQQVEELRRLAELLASRRRDDGASRTAASEVRPGREEQLQLLAEERR